MKTRTTESRTPAKTSGSGLKVQKILVPTDYSIPAEKALKYAIPFARQFGATITLVHIVDGDRYPSFVPMEMERKRILQGLSEYAESQMKKLEQRYAPEAPLSKKSIVRTGKPYEEIVKVAGQLKADMIIMATHGYTGLKHTLLGSTAERVVRHARCPVLTVRGL
jgi:universal stress protein A